MCWIEFQFPKHSNPLFFDKLDVHSALFSQLCFVFQGRADFWCAGLNLNFVNFHIHYFLTNKVFALFFPTFLLFKLESRNLVCRCE